jgi:DNA-binding LacI/PurR family transcriptional regulator
MKSTSTTMKEMAKQLGVSVSTVSRALQNHPRIGSRTRERVHALAESLHYFVNNRAINFKNKRSYNIGIVLPYLTEQFFSLALSGIEESVSAKGYRVLVMQSKDDYQRESDAITSLMKHGVDGILVSMASETYNKKHFHHANFPIPLVFFDRVIKHTPYSIVYANMKDAAFQVMEYVILKGYKKIALLNGPNSLQATEDRLKGYLEALDQYQLPTNLEYITNINLTKEDTRLKVQYLLELPSPPEVILTFHDYIALDAMQVCKEKGLKINQDIFFASFSNLSFCDYLDTPPIVTVEQFPFRMGQQAASILLNAIESPDTYQPQEIVIPCKLITRG